MERFDWTKFDVDFLKEIVYSEKTSEEIKPLFETNDVNMLIPSMLAIAEVPDREFIMMYRTEIEFKLFKNYPDLVRELSGVSKNTNYLTELNKL